MRGKLKDLTFGRNGEQHITITVTGDFRDEYDRLKGQEINFEVKRWRDPRSKDANAYFHVLVNKIAEAQNLGDEEVKRHLVSEYGALARDEDGQIIGAMLPAGTDISQFYPYTRMFKERVIDGKHYECYLFYKRSHELDSKEMARLIDGTIFEARELGIDTDTPEMIARIKEEWETIRNRTSSRRWSRQFRSLPARPVPRPQRRLLPRSGRKSGSPDMTAA